MCELPISLICMFVADGGDQRNSMEAQEDVQTQHRKVPARIQTLIF